MATKRSNYRASRQREWERMQRAQEREAKRLAREQEAARKAAEKAAREQYLAARTAEAEQRTREVEARANELGSILIGGLRRSSRLTFRALMRTFVEPQMDLGPLAYPQPQPTPEQYAPPRPDFLTLLFRSARYEAAKAHGRQRYEAALREWESAELERRRRVDAARREHAEWVARERSEVEQYNRRLAEYMEGFAKREREAVEFFATQVLQATPRPADFPQRAKVTYSGAPEELMLVEFELPPTNVVPRTREYRYVKARDEITESARPKRDIDELYRATISQLSLLCIHSIFRSDQEIQKIAFNGHVQSINPATGKQEFPCLISLVVDRADFSELVLEQVNPADCLKHLKAIVSHHPYALEGVQPIMDFDTNKYRFVQGLDAASLLDSRPDLMAMSPENFEHLVRQVFEAHPEFEGWTTTQSNDDGVDGVVINKTALVGGLAIVQAKRYKMAIGKNHIRELAGTMDEKRAGKGILVTTSYFTTGAEQTARENGRIELIDGPRLTYLIKEKLGKDVLIGIDFPKRVMKE